MVATLLVLNLAPVRFGYASPSMHVAFETAAASIALLAAYLVVGRFRHSRELDALLLACSLAMFGSVNLLLGALPAALDQELGTSAAWMSAVGRLVATIVLVAAAWAPPVRLRTANVERLVFLAAANVLVLLWLFPVFGGDRLPLAVDPRLTPELSSFAWFGGHPLVHGIQLVGAVLFSAAAVGFLRKPGRGELSRWIAPACVFGAFACIHYFLYPSLYSQWFYTGDVFRLLFYLLLVTGVAREIWHYEGQTRRLAVLEERRRIARDLHDGLAQELSYIAGAAKTLRAEPILSLTVTRIGAAAERALDESRRAIAALTQPSDDCFDRALAQAAFEVANRVGTRLALELDPGVRVSARTQEQLIRIVREAVTNAARHGRAETVKVALTNGDGLTLLIADDGLGFEPDATNGLGFGLVSMTERAHALGGELRVVSAPAGGTAVSVVLPQAALE